MFHIAIPPPEINKNHSITPDWGKIANAFNRVLKVEGRRLKVITAF
jgi:hypothetical protein